MNTRDTHRIQCYVLLWMHRLVFAVILLMFAIPLGGCHHQLKWNAKLSLGLTDGMSRNDVKQHLGNPDIQHDLITFISRLDNSEWDDGHGGQHPSYRMYVAELIVERISESNDSLVIDDPLAYLQSGMPNVEVWIYDESKRFLWPYRKQWVGHLKLFTEEGHLASVTIYPWRNDLYFGRPVRKPSSTGVSRIVEKDKKGSNESEFDVR